MVVRVPGLDNAAACQTSPPRCDLAQARKPSAPIVIIDADRTSAG